MLELLAIFFAALWTTCLLAANPAGGFLHVFLVLAIICACVRPAGRSPEKNLPFRSSP